MSGVIYDRFGSIVSTVEEYDDKNVIYGVHADQTPILEDNARARSMGRLGVVNDTGLEPLARYHETMVSQWLQEAGITRRQFATWPSEERLKWLENKVLERDNRKHLRRDVPGYYV